MDFKALIKTKIFWVGLLAIGGGIIEAVFEGWSQGMDKIMVGFAMIVGRVATTNEAKKAVDNIPVMGADGMSTLGKEVPRQ